MVGAFFVRLRCAGGTLLARMIWDGIPLLSVRSGVPRRLTDRRPEGGQTASLTDEGSSITERTACRDLRLEG